MTQTTKQTDYQKQAADFLEQTQTSFFVKYLKTGKYFEDDKEKRDIYEIELLKGIRGEKPILRSSFILKGISLFQILINTINSL